ncbi:NmrA family transcriptional regulator [Actinosynnema sp. ALI-1.44]|uniref:NmrA family NAD(P)-binding protein n=1 Tax=Actinosynnema sp. ALI-1.44 TaxID=1933779 RepID=UPI00097CA9F9|nr:NAD(P)H-binding protein [Actinosynnema sp. ALI-1.44]ONI79745.1 NmrA family transcriptional regulator [Actinosynnema sp. ALI-1.44]
MTILVTGATGNVGRHVVRGLAEAGARVRAMTRDPAAAVFGEGVEVARGDLGAPDDIPFDGVEKLFLFVPSPDVRDVVDVAAKAGVRRIVVLSSGAVTHGYDTTYHLPVEQAVEASGVEWTHVRPGEFATNKIDLWGPSIRADGTIVHPEPDEYGQPIHERDIAEVAVAALLQDGHAGRAYTLTGPAQLTQRAMAADIGAAIGRELTFTTVSRQEALEYYVSVGWPEESARYLVGLGGYEGAEADDFSDYQFTVSPDFEAVTGRPYRTFARWALDHAADFTPAS